MQLQTLPVIGGRVPVTKYFPRFVAAGIGKIRAALEALTRTPRALLYGALLCGAAALFLAFALSAFFLSFPVQKVTASGALPPTGAATAGVPLFPLEMHIANNGLVLLRGARVESVAGTVLTVSTDWGTTNFTWTVLTNGSSYGNHNFGTAFLNRDGGPLSLASIHVGDRVTITGMLQDSPQEPTLHADSVRDLEE